MDPLHDRPDWDAGAVIEGLFVVFMYCVIIYLVYA